MSNHTRTAVVIACVVLATQALVLVATYYVFPDWPTRGQFGDVFGAANAFFSGLAFTGLIYTIFLQREELSLQRKELELTRTELQRSAQAQEQSEHALREQAAAANQSARLAATNFLLEHYDDLLKPLKNRAYAANDPTLETIKELERRVEVLRGVLDSVYVQLSGE